MAKNTRNTLVDLHNLLMETVERLNDADPDELEIELKRAKGISDVGKVICSNSGNMIQAQRVSNDAGYYYKTNHVLIGQVDDE